ncbi:Plant protein of unknown function (DUF639 [Striga hermonthica]|uniref:Uncharacterized protein n=1 Tax=Striga hermonthica TaxID=68872 RepID=A0A9N7RA19_STRHE|nr:Plant protein of unknown function (DUF639 [Striga hermonthica]
MADYATANNMEIKHLSTIANDVVRRCAQKLDASVSSLVEEFEKEWEPQMAGYSRKLVEFCCSRALMVMCVAIDENITNGTFSRFTFDMMLAWEVPSSADEESRNECVAKENEEKKVPVVADELHDDVSLFYSDLMPLLVDREPNVGEDAFVWLGTLVPLVVEMVNGRFTFETLTAPTGNRLHFPAYDKFLKEIHGCVKHLQKQETPRGVEFLDDEFILHVEGTVNSQRVVRHIGGTSWPGRLTLTNYALYFEASGIVSYEDALKLDLSKDSEQSVKPTATGPWGAPLFDKAIVYESSELQEGIILEFPEVTSSTRRDHWLALVREIILLHRFLSKYKVDPTFHAWEMHSRTILGIVRLHAAREMLRISPPLSKSFLIFTLLDDLPKGDYVLEELAGSLGRSGGGAHPCSASSILRNLNVSRPSCPVEPRREIVGGDDNNKDMSSLESAINQAREEGKEMEVARASAEGLKVDGISESAQVLMGLLEPVKSEVPKLLGVFTWERPLATSIVIVSAMVVIYKEWVGPAVSSFLLWAVAKMMWARYERMYEKKNKVVIHTGSDQTAMESIVSAQQGLRTLHEILRETNIALLKIWSIMLSKAPRVSCTTSHSTFLSFKIFHTNTVMMILTCSAVVLAVVPFKVILMVAVLYGFVMTSKIGKRLQSDPGNRRLREWWDSIPVVPVEFVDKEAVGVNREAKCNIQNKGKGDGNVWKYGG